MAEKFEIVKIQETFRVTPAGDTVPAKQILFTVGVDGPFSVEIPSAEFNADIARAAVEAEADEILKTRGAS